MNSLGSKLRHGLSNGARIVLMSATIVTLSGAIAPAQDSAPGVRMMLKVQIPVEAGNRAVADGTMKSIIEDTMEQIKPEAAYFSQEDGLRTIYFVYQVTDNATFAAVHEPLMQGLGARVSDLPALTWDELSQGFGAIGEDQ
ncbi:hypothetical protein [Bauldia sp.]|uniref:hypothetical protein n=1 Tax=Bauldia sp. TaxID=2575872 RepID=UPI003BA9E546